MRARTTPLGPLLGKIAFLFSPPSFPLVKRSPPPLSVKVSDPRNVILSLSLSISPLHPHLCGSLTVRLRFEEAEIADSKYKIRLIPSPDFTNPRSDLSRSIIFCLGFRLVLLQFITGSFLLIYGLFYWVCFRSSGNTEAGTFLDSDSQ
jgi:hypothetical protein